MASLPDQATLNRLLRYDPESGLLFWRPRGNVAWDRKNAGKRAFTTRRGGRSSGSGYFAGTLLGQCVYAHRVIWRMVHGETPLEIDHIDGDRTNNRVENLRDVGRSENAKNQPRPRTNRSGVIGVGWYRRAAKWQAQGTINYHNEHLGFFASFEDAVAARRTWELKHNFHPNHGR